MAKVFTDLHHILLVYTNISMIQVTLQIHYLPLYICDSPGMLDEFGWLTKVMIYPACTT